MSQLLDLFLKKDNFQKVIQKISSESTQLVTGIADSGRAVLMAAIWEEVNHPVVVFTTNLHQANRLYDDLSVFVDEDKVFIYNVNDMIHTQLSVASPEEQAERIEAIEFLLSGEAGIVIIPVAGSRRLLPPKAIYEKSRIHLSTDSEIELEKLMNQLVSIGYEREQIVARPGEFSVRGGIVDIYPLTERYPVRIELFDIEVDSIRSFDAGTQRSIQQLDEIKIVPVTETIVPVETREIVTERLQQAYEQTSEQTEDEETQKLLGENVLPVIESLEEDDLHEDLTVFRDFLYEEQTTIIDYLAKDAVLLYDEYPRILENNQKLAEEELVWKESSLKAGRILKNQELSVDFTEQQSKLQGSSLYFSLFQRGMGGLTFTSTHEFHYRPMQNFFAQMPIIQTEVQAWKNRGFTQVIMTENADRAQEVEEIFKDHQMEAKIVSEDMPLEQEKIQILDYTLQQGFELVEEKVAVLTEKELFNRLAKKRRRQLNISNAERIKSYNELKVITN